MDPSTYTELHILQAIAMVHKAVSAGITWARKHRMQLCCSAVEFSYTGVNDAMSSGFRVKEQSTVHFIY